MNTRRIVINHYEVLSLPSSPTDGPKVSATYIAKAYRLKALQLHPDKCPNDPNANSNFQQLKSSCDILINPDSRKIFDAQLNYKPAHKFNRSFRKTGVRKESPFNAAEEFERFFKETRKQYGSPFKMFYAMQSARDRRERRDEAVRKRMEREEEEECLRVSRLEESERKRMARLDEWERKSREKREKLFNDLCSKRAT